MGLPFVDGWVVETVVPVPRRWSVVPFGMDGVLEENRVSLGKREVDLRDFGVKDDDDDDSPVA